MREFGEVADSPTPVMTFQVAGSWLGVPVEKMDRITSTERLWPVPLALPHHLGLMHDNGELLPVLTLATRLDMHTHSDLVAVVHVRGDSVGIAIDAAGRVYDDYRVHPGGSEAPLGLAIPEPKWTRTPNTEFWLFDPDRLWQNPGGNAVPPTPTV